MRSRVVQHEETLSLWSNVELGYYAAPAADADDKWNRTVCNINRLPKYWMAKLIGDCDPSEEGFNPELLKRIDDHDGLGDKTWGK